MPGAPRSYFQMRLSPVVAMNSELPLSATARGWSSAIERGSATAPSRGVPERPAPQMVSMSPLRSSMRRIAWLPVSATYSASRHRHMPCGRLNAASSIGPSMKPGPPLPNWRSTRPAWSHSSTRWCSQSATYR
jgi:hypothetical protein